MSTNNLNPDSQFRYIVQWFNEWSELQREDFVPFLVEYLTSDGQQGAYVNGVVSGLANADCSDRPLSLFQCRIKLFKEWSPKWPEGMRSKLKEKIVELDPKIGEKVDEELASVGTGRGQVNGTAEPHIEGGELEQANGEDEKPAAGDVIEEVPQVA